MLAGAKSGVLSGDSCAFLALVCCSNIGSTARSLPLGADIVQETPPFVAHARDEPPGFTFAAGSGSSTALRGELRAVGDGS
jgi:hypothetical protein